MTCRIVALILAILAIALILSADTLTETNVTTDSASVLVDAGAGQVFVCSDAASGFSCVDSQAFICYGWANCEALDAVGGSWFDNDTVAASVAVPEPDSLALLLAGLLGVAAIRWAARAGNRRLARARL